VKLRKRNWGNAKAMTLTKLKLNSQVRLWKKVKAKKKWPNKIQRFLKANSSPIWNNLWNKKEDKLVKFLRQNIQSTKQFFNI